MDMATVGSRCLRAWRNSLRDADRTSMPPSSPNPFVVMNDRLVNDPVPLTQTKSGNLHEEMEETIYRVLERDPEDRYASARQLRLDPLNTRKTSGATDRSKKPAPEARMPITRERVLSFAIFGMIPAAIFELLHLVARHK